MTVREDLTPTDGPQRPSGPGLLARLRHDDRGSASSFVVALFVVLLVVAGLVADGGRAVNARVAITDDAEQAARAGADQVDAETLRTTGALVIDPSRATAAATELLAARGYASSRMRVVANTDEVTVTVSDDVTTSLLQLAFIDSFTVEGTASARAALGIDAELGAGP